LVFAVAGLSDEMARPTSQNISRADENQIDHPRRGSEKLYRVDVVMK